jgi:hypothetical protein
LAAVTNALTPLEASYARLAALDRAPGSARSEPEWQRVRTAFHVAGLRLRADAERLVAGLFERFVGGGPAFPLTVEGVRHLGRPFRELLRALQSAVARPADFARFEEACWSHALAQLRGTGPYAEGAPGKRAVWPARTKWSAARRLFDRPAVWDVVNHMPPVGRLRDDARTWQVFLESCRLTLALRVFREVHGRWPERLDQLVPAILPALPKDPFGDGPFGYECTEQGWSFWSVGPAGRRPGPEEGLAPPQRLFVSGETPAPE